MGIKGERRERLLETRQTQEKHSYTYPRWYELFIQDGLWILKPKLSEGSVIRQIYFWITGVLIDKSMWRNNGWNLQWKLSEFTHTGNPATATQKKPTSKYTIKLPKTSNKGEKKKMWPEAGCGDICSPSQVLGDRQVDICEFEPALFT